MPRPAGVDELGPKLRHLRERLGISAAEVARAVGVSRMYLNRIERGTINANTGKPHRISEEQYWQLRDAIIALANERIHEMQKVLNEEGGLSWQ